jgi:isopentenyl diphosphate isomerase/L-lactate dehydrogenase-like FMN-dependent dehydrogenase
VVRVLELIEDEMRICLGLLGVANLKGLDRSYLHAGAPPVMPAHVHSALPLIGEGY